MKYTMIMYCKNECTTKQYVDQFNPIRLEVGKTYIQESSSWSKKHYVILYVDGNIAVGKSVYNQINNLFIGNYELFYVDNGFKYNDICRENYRLVKEI